MGHPETIMTTGGFNYTIAFYLAVQAVVTVASAEVTFRYFRWWLATSKKDGLLLRSLIVGIALTHLMIFGDCLSLIYERIAHPRMMDEFMEAARALYVRQNFLKVGLYLGVVAHLVPIWRIVHKYTIREVIVAAAARTTLALSFYVGALWYFGVLGCYLYASFQCQY